MSDTYPQSPELDSIKQAVGDCILAWANVESRVLIMFRLSMGNEFLRADAIWGSIKSFDAKMTVYRDAARVAFAGHKLWPDIQLLDQCTMRFYKRRNQVAHATLINVVGVGPIIQPFFTLSTTLEGIRLSETDIRATAEEFRALDFSYLWAVLKIQRTSRTTPTPPVPPEPELLLRLREEDARIREAQRQRDQDAKLVERLRQAGKWPPPD